MVTAEVLLDAAEQRMRKGGYNAVSFRDLAADAAIKSASVHYHFPRKEDLGLALVARYRERFFEALDARAAKAKTPHDRVRAICDVYRNALTVDGSLCLCGMLGAESAGLPPALSESVAAFFEANIEWVRDALSSKWTLSRREKFAMSTIATLQGGMMIATAMKRARAFDRVVEAILAGVDPRE